MAYISVEVDVELDKLEDQELIDELEGLGWFVSEEEPDEPDDWLRSRDHILLTTEEKEVILDMVSRSKPGTIGYNIYEKIRKR